MSQQNPQSKLKELMNQKKEMEEEIDALSSYLTTGDAKQFGFNRSLIDAQGYLWSLLCVC
jgi:hypothetical protein